MKEEFIEKNLVSVIIPVYKVEKYLDRCLLSVRKSSYRNLEILCIDDGSPDASLSILRRHQAEDERIRVISRENRGLAETRNEALARVQGAYVTYVDSDDWIHPQMIEWMVASAQTHEVPLVVCGREVVDERQTDLDKAFQKLENTSSTCIFPKTNSYEAQELQDIKAQGLKAEVFPSSSYYHIGVLRYYFWGKLYRRDLLAGQTFDRACEPAEDRVFNALLLARNPDISFALIRQPLYTYVKREGSIMDSTSRASLLSPIRVLLRIYQEEGSSGGNWDYVLEDTVKLFLSAREAAAGEDQAKEKLRSFAAELPELRKTLSLAKGHLSKKELIKWRILLQSPGAYRSVISLINRRTKKSS